jgi:hypothetical protein
MRQISTGAMSLLVTAVGLGALAIAAGPVSARTWYVKPDSTGDVPTISVAVDSAAAEGDTVLLADGTFTGAGNRMVDCLDKALVITSESGNPELCVIDCGGTFCFETVAAFFLRSSQPGAQRVEAVTVMRGCGGVVCDDGARPDIVDCIFRNNTCPGCEVGNKGAGILILNGSSPTIADCVFHNNRADGGGGIASFDSSPTVTNVTFYDNSGSGGGGMMIEGGSATLTDCSFTGNHAGSLFGSRFGGGGFLCRGSAEVVNCEFIANECWRDPGGGLYFLPEVESDHLSVVGCVFIGNHIDENELGGSGLGAGYPWASPAGSMSIINCTFSGNSAGGWVPVAGLWTFRVPDVLIENTLIAFTDSGPAISCASEDMVILRCCNLYGNSHGDWVEPIDGQLGINGNISTDPLFCDTLSGDYRLETCSPCLPGNHPDGYDCGVPIGAYCSGCACKTATVPTTWGAIKAMYR